VEEVIQLPEPIFIPVVDTYLRKRVRELMETQSKAERSSGEEVVNTAYRNIMSEIQYQQKIYSQCKKGLVDKKKLINSRMMMIMEAVQFVDLLKVLSSHNVSLPVAISMTNEHAEEVNVNTTVARPMVWLGQGVYKKMSCDDARARLVALFKFNSMIVDRIQTSLNFVIDGLCTLQVNLVRIATHAREAAKAKMDYQAKVVADYLAVAARAEKEDKERQEEKERQEAANNER